MVQIVNIKSILKYVSYEFSSDGISKSAVSFYAFACYTPSLEPYKKSG